ncbi:formate--tetrahydrofolate ligase [Philodulcilactobacillus myokoensis]|uniref:Formate--tetrahydrofolate ligase n=1 Tax=Philodulcilactobacillus myokoensis TaxID=2929573 RepID=A0A9W6ET88_9LACO|nr:formate--tetrahydrofolate ligase [Philodulcilactobacillus myokoensis]GLB46869.1 formate--tetrahydrofolate ligase [Philodulcilactobacillus myokoensis]
MKTDIEISQDSDIEPIEKIAQKLNLSRSQIELYGDYKAKVKLPIKNQNTKRKLILMTSINPTAAGEGKTTVTIGLGDALNRLKYKTAIALREPSLGPVMGIKGGATGGGHAQVIPMEDINLHFTGDLHALTEANDTLSALIDNHIHHGNQLNLDPRRITWKRVVDINDRELRHAVIGLGGPTSGVPREDGFNITVASELMAILCLSNNLMDLKQKVSKILIGYTYDRKPVTVKDLGVTGAITLLLKDAIKPNLVQTLEHTPTFVHGGPFANIAHGCNSILATNAALNTADYAITEAGFGSDLGGEKFMDITSKKLGKYPDAVVIVATVRALKLNGGMNKNDLNYENTGALKRGADNLAHHIHSMQQYGKPVIVAINRFTSDTDKEINLLEEYINQLDVKSYETNVWSKGGAGAEQLAKAVVAACDRPSQFKPLYHDSDSIMDKLNAIVKNIYGGDGVELSYKAKRQIKQLEKLGWDKLPLCIAKTQYSLTDNAKLLGNPKHFKIHVRGIEPKLGAGFIVILTGKVLTMPGLPSHPAALDMDIDKNGKIKGLF